VTLHPGADSSIGWQIHVLLNLIGNIYMKEDSLKILQGERQQEVQTKLNGIRVSIVEQKRKSHHTEDEVQIDIRTCTCNICSKFSSDDHVEFDNGRSRVEQERSSC
jgi:hypothetical protein